MNLDGLAKDGTPGLTLLHLEWSVADLPLVKPLVTSTFRIDARKVVVIVATVEIDGQVATGYGEAAPMAGWTVETADDCIQALEAIAAAGIEPQSFNLFEPGALDAVFPSLGALPSLRFGIELAFLDALARHRRVPLRQLFSARAAPVADGVPVQFTLGVCSTRETLRLARQAIAQGYEGIKLKIGNEGFEEAIDRVTAVRKACPDVILRLDANGAFDFSTALAFSRAIAPLDMDYIEQPLAARDIEGLMALAMESPVPIAADESCVAPAQGLQLLASSAVPVLIVKPMAMGGLLSTLSFIGQANQKGLKVVLSSLIESAIARRAIAHLAMARLFTDDDTSPQGLATGPWLAMDLAPRGDAIVTGRLHLGDGPGIGFIPQVEAQLRPPQGGAS